MYSKVLQCKTFMVWQHLTLALELLAVHQARAGMPCNSSKVHKLSALTCGGDGGAGEPGVWCCVVAAKGRWCTCPDKGVTGPLVGLSSFVMLTVGAGGGPGGGGRTIWCSWGDLDGA